MLKHEPLRAQYSDVLSVSMKLCLQIAKHHALQAFIHARLCILYAHASDKVVILCIHIAFSIPMFNLCQNLASCNAHVRFIIYLKSSLGDYIIFI